MVAGFLVAALVLAALQVWSLARLAPRPGDVAVLSAVLVSPFVLGAAAGAVALALALDTGVGGWTLAFLLAAAVALAMTIVRNRVAAHWPAARQALHSLDIAVKHEEAAENRRRANLHPMVLEA